MEFDHENKKILSFNDGKKKTRKSGIIILKRLIIKYI